MALLVLDVQQEIVERYAAHKLVERLAKAVEAARVAAVPVIFVRVLFREGFPEIDRRNRLLSGVADAGRLLRDTPGVDFPPTLKPLPGEITIEKRRVSAFSGSDLGVIVRAQGIETLVLAGIATSGVVLSTVREAADLDFGLVVLRDGCTDNEPEVHRFLVERIFPRQAETPEIEEWSRTLSLP